MQQALQKFFGYFLTGGLAAIVDAGGFALLHPTLLQVIPAAVISFSTSAVVNYLSSSRYVFKQVASKHHFYQFFLVALIGLAINVSITYYLLLNFEMLPAIAKIIAIGIAFFINFLLNYLIVFRENS